MRKFTVFTVILTILVVVVAAETFVNKYLPSLKGSVLQADQQTGQQVDQQDTDKYNLPSELESKSIAKPETTVTNNSVSPQTSVPQTNAPQTTSPQSTSQSTADNFEFLGVNAADGQIQTPLDPSQPQTLPSTSNLILNDIPSTISSTIPDTTIIPNTTSSSTASSTSVLPVLETALDLPTDSSFDIEDFSNSQPSSASYLRDDQIINSGFTGSRLETEIYDGFLYKTINISDLKGIKVEKYNVGDGTNTYVKVYIITVSDPAIFNDIYNVIKSRAAEGIDTEVNETNDYGSGSFYMNDIRRSGVAFLTVKIGSRIYGFTYPKTYHPQIKNLISLLMLDNR